MALKFDRYTYLIAWSDEDAQYVGFCAEFPALAWLDETPEEALEGIREVVNGLVIDLLSNGERVPKPFSCLIQ